MPVTDPRSRLSDSDTDGLVADITNTDPKPNAAGLVVRAIQDSATRAGASANVELAGKVVTGTPDTDTGNLKVPLTAARMQAVAGGKWRSVSAHDAGGGAVGLLTKILDAEPVRVVVVSGAGAAGAQTGGTQPVSVTTLPLPQGAATEATLVALAQSFAGAPAQEHTLPTSPSAVRLTDGEKFLTPTTPSDTQPVSVASLPLPTGSATEATLQRIPAPVGGRVPVDGSGVTHPVSVASLPLPSGAATEGGNLATIATRLGGTLAVTPAPNASFFVNDAGGSLTVDSPQLPTALVGGRLAVDVLPNDIRLGGAPVSLANPIPVFPPPAPTINRTPNAASLPAAGSSFVVVPSGALLKRIEWRYTGTGIKYLVVMDSATSPAATSTWTRWQRPMRPTDGISYFEWPEGLRCASGVVLAVSATEVLGTLTLSAAPADAFYFLNASWN